MQILIGRYTREKDIPVGIPIANRSNHLFNDVVGLFVNTAVLRSDFGRSKEPTLGDIVKQVRQQMLTLLGEGEGEEGECKDLSRVPFELLVRHFHRNNDMNNNSNKNGNSSGRRDIQYNPFFQIMMVQQTQEEGSNFHFNGIATERVEVLENTAKLDLTVTITTEEANGDPGNAHPPRQRISMQYATDIYRESKFLQFIPILESLIITTFLSYEYVDIYRYYPADI